jgi:uncharacterized membrane protein
MHGTVLVGDFKMERALKNYFVYASNITFFNDILAIPK